MSVEKQSFGTTKKGEAISLYTVTNKNGMVIKVTDFGAILVSVLVPDKNGVLTDVVLGYDHGEDYQVNSPHFGATIGRNGNRIKNASFVLNGKKIQLTPNEKENNLHSGPDGFEFMMWEAETKEQAVAFRHHSPDGEQGFPGNFDVTVTYTLTDDNAVEIHYEGISVVYSSLLCCCGCRFLIVFHGNIVEVLQNDTIRTVDFCISYIILYFYEYNIVVRSQCLTVF